MHGFRRKIEGICSRPRVKTLEKLKHTLLFRDPSRFIEGDLKLLSRLESLSASEMSHATSALPDAEFPSDHIPLLAKFALL